MKRRWVGVWLALGASLATAQEAPELVLVQHPFRMYSAFWPNLHHVLWASAWAKRPTQGKRSPAGALPEPLTGDLTADERAAWDRAVAYYDREMADLDLLFGMSAIRKALIQPAGELPKTGLDPRHREALAAAAPVYRKYWWPAHDRANREWIASTMPNVAALTPAVPERLAALYETPWFTTGVRVDVVRVAHRQGAYTSTDPEPAHITISSSKPENSGWMGAEVLFHESSHALVRPIFDGFAAEAKAQGKNTRDLWHVALFYLTGETVRQTLAGRGIAYEPYLYKTGLFDAAWPQFKPAIETYWSAYVHGEAPRAEAIRKTVAAVK